jgi:chromosome segregation ATPase
MTISSTDELTTTTESHDEAPEAREAMPEGGATASAPAVSAGPEDAAAERRRLEAELAAIERKREELARALIVNAHPELADPIRVLTGRLYAVSRVEERMREPLSKAEVRKVESLGKKRESLTAKRAELDAKRAEIEAEIGSVDHELAQLGDERTKGFERERDEALEQLVVSLAQLGPSFDAAGVDPVRLVDGLAARMPDVKSTAEALASRASA